MENSNFKRRRLEEMEDSPSHFETDDVTEVAVVENVAITSDISTVQKMIALNADQFFENADIYLPREEFLTETFEVT